MDSEFLGSKTDLNRAVSEVTLTNTTINASTSIDIQTTSSMASTEKSDGSILSYYPATEKSNSLKSSTLHDINSIKSHNYFGFTDTPQNLQSDLENVDIMSDIINMESSLSRQHRDSLSKKSKSSNQSKEVENVSNQRDADSISNHRELDGENRRDIVVDEIEQNQLNEEMLDEDIDSMVSVNEQYRQMLNSKTPVSELDIDEYETRTTSPTPLPTPVRMFEADAGLKSTPGSSIRTGESTRNSNPIEAKAIVKEEALGDSEDEGSMGPLNHGVSI